MGIKERRTKILLTLFLLSDVNLSYVEFNEQALLPFDLTLNQKTRGTLSGLIKEGLIEKDYMEHVSGPQTVSDISQVPQALQDTGGGEAPVKVTETTKTGASQRYRLTDKGFTEICLFFPFVRFLREKWDLKWRILSYEIPEKKRELRDKLRREVSGWGLGPWHRSFWVTPHPIIESLQQLVSQKEEEKYVQAFESEHVFGDRAVLIEKVWELSQLDKKYRELFKKWHDVLAKEGDKVSKFKQVINDYIGILRDDPGLPVELVGEKWIGFESYNIYKEIRSILLG